MQDVAATVELLSLISPKNVIHYLQKRDSSILLSATPSTSRILSRNATKPPLALSEGTAGLMYGDQQTQRPFLLLLAELKACGI